MRKRKTKKEKRDDVVLWNDYKFDLVKEGMKIKLKKNFVAFCADPIELTEKEQTIMLHPGEVIKIVKKKDGYIYFQYIKGKLLFKSTILGLFLHEGKAEVIDD